MNKRLPIEDALIKIENKCIETNYEFCRFDDSVCKYSRLKFLNFKSRIILKCKIDFTIIVTTYLWFINNNVICPRCREKKYIENVNEKCKRKNYTLLSTEVLNTKTKLLFKCNNDNHKWHSSYNNFIIKNSNCPKCDKSFQLTNDEAIININDRCKELKYSFNGFIDGKFKNVHSKLLLKCECNHDWNPSYYQFVYIKHKCPICQKVYKYNKFEIEEKVRYECKLRGYTFIKFVGEYKKTKSKIILNCGKHENWIVSCDNFLIIKTGCPYCPISTNSKGENLITKILKEKNILFIKQHKFNNCKNIKPLRFDFYLPEYNACIEYDGQQHFHEIDFWGGVWALNKVQINDNIKTNYCLDNKIALLRIKYNENVNEKLNEFINQFYLITHKQL